MIGISACLVGENCKYNGNNNLRENMLDLKKDAVLICPEVLGGMSIPRKPSEIEKEYCGEDVLKGNAKVIDADENDVTEYFITGAYKALEIVKKYNITKVYLKQSSPSCGSGKIYDGTFENTKKCGNGVAAALFKQNGIEVIGVE